MTLVHVDAAPRVPIAHLGGKFAQVGAAVLAGVGVDRDLALVGCQGQQEPPDHFCCCEAGVNHGGNLPLYVNRTTAITTRATTFAATNHRGTRMSSDMRRDSMPDGGGGQQQHGGTNA